MTFLLSEAGKVYDSCLSIHYKLLIFRGAHVLLCIKHYSNKMPGGRPVKLKLLDAFERVNRDDNKAPLAICKTCYWQILWHPTRMEGHLDKCAPRLKQELIISSYSPTRLRDVTDVFFPRHKGPFTIQFQQFSPKLNDQVCKYLTKIVIMDNLPFNTFDRNKDLSKFFTIINPSIRLPRRKQLASKYLDDVYNDVSAHVKALINRQNLINFISNKSTNIRKERVLNLCCYCHKLGAFYLKYKTIGKGSMDAQYLSHWLEEEMVFYTYKRYNIINAIISNTCSTQRAVGHYLIENNHRLSHVFWIPYNSHSLQLFIRHLFLRRRGCQTALLEENSKVQRIDKD
jgi:hypothetical protein